MKWLALWCLGAIIAASAYSAWKWGIDEGDEIAENDEQLRERIELARQREAGTR